jgi:uncharacterized MAPEG superfamily protein
MTVADWMLLAAVLLPYATVAAAKWTDPAFENHDPTAWAAGTDKLRRRLVAAQRNGFEGFPAFAAAVLLAQQLGAAQTRVDLLAVGYVVCRLAYIGCYAADRPSARSAVWGLGFLCVLVIFLSSA